MEKIKWGVLGCAGIAAEQTIPAMQQAENAELYGIASRGLEKAEAFQKRFGFAKAYDSYEALLDDPHGSGGLYPAAQQPPWRVGTESGGEGKACAL